jgi:hypothetical protein
MRSFTRRAFLKSSGALSALTAGSSSNWVADEQANHWTGGEMGNSAFRLTHSETEGLNNLRLTHLPSGLVLAQGNYSYSCGRPGFHGSSVAETPDGSKIVSFQGTAPGGDLEVLQQIRVPREKPWIEEQITLTNRSHSPMDLHEIRCGFVLPLPFAAGEVSGDWKDFKFYAIPFRREPNGNLHQYADFSLSAILAEQYSSELWTEETTVTPAYASEGWAWTDGRRGFLITKYSPAGMEWSLLDRVPLEGNRAGLRWGGCGIYRGNPEHGAWLRQDESHQFGLTRVTAFQGGMKEGFYVFREEMAERGHGCPQGFNPPVHWNELYDNKLYWLPDWDDPGMRKIYYTLGEMKEEAAKAKAIGCQALYMDPGWDTNFASKIWDDARLGTYKSFTEMLRNDYGLESSLHTPLSGWCNPSSYPPEMHRMDRFGTRLTWNRARGFLASTLCGMSRQYLEETARRLKTLARDGAAYFMFDGTQYHGECWDPAHGHSVPGRREEHAQAMCRLARMVHAEYPRVLIEMHDPVNGGNIIRYAPTYYGHGKAPAGETYSEAMGFDSVWAFELMWMPMEDLLSGRAIALYYYNLAYHLPLYIHIDLRTDNRNALVFWWNASTCRHLGIGGTHKDPLVLVAHQEAMATYLRFQEFFKAGTFYGLDETVHVHVHPRESAAVINCFNLSDDPMERIVEFHPAEVGLDSNGKFKFAGPSSQPVDAGYRLTFNVPAHGHRLAEVTRV